MSHFSPNNESAMDHGPHSSQPIIGPGCASGDQETVFCGMGRGYNEIDLHTVSYPRPQAPP